MENAIRENGAFTEYTSEERCTDCGRPIIMAKAFGISIRKMCVCEEERQKAEREKYIRSGEAVIRSGMREHAGLLKKWRERTLASFHVKPGQEAAYEAASEFVKNINGKSGATGIIFSGAAGCGKTHLAAAIANAVIDTHFIYNADALRAGEFGIVQDDFTPVHFTNTVDLITRIKSSFDSHDETTREIIKPYQKAWVTILDDLGAENPTEFVRERLFEIIDYRYSAELPLIITTNTTPAELKKQIGGRNFDRIREVCKYIPITAAGQRTTA